MNFENILITLGWFILACFISTILTGLFRRYAISKGLIDIPNQRSSHHIPVPRGGGVAIVVTFFVLLSNLVVIGKLDMMFYLGLLGASVLVTVIGFLDDHRHIPARWRLMVHFLGAGWALVWLGGLPPISVFGNILDFGWLGHILTGIYLVWMVNLYNFMDGIDGIAGIEAVTVCLGGTILYFLSSTDGGEWSVQVILIGAFVGFLFWNFPKAKIFMGDVGSGFTGMVIGILSVKAASVTPELFWGWIILLGIFLVDATFTLIRRVLHGQKFYQAHRIHAYQRAARRWGHMRVSLSVALINIVWLLPFACFSVLYPSLGLILMILAFLPLIILAYRLGAGCPEVSC